MEGNSAPRKSFDILALYKSDYYYYYYSNMFNIIIINIMHRRTNNVTVTLNLFDDMTALRAFSATTGYIPTTYFMS